MYLRYAATFIYGISGLVLAWALVTHTLRLRADDVWFALLLLVVPATMVFGAVWVFLDKTWWRPVLVFILLVPSVTLWGAVLLYAYAGFRIH
ncbi:MAG: hypothetical protein HKN83_05020 [Gammaproteobacteria bacterium]|nr:hypothetical protein [Gammaproteobacteria bacterium]